MSLTIGIPTWNRANILADCLARLPDIDCQVIVSDNASTDETAEVVYAAGEIDHRIEYAHLDEHQDGFTNFRNCVRHARGELIVCLSDDDTLLRDPLAAHVERMDLDRSLVALYADPIAWDDAGQKELHRYFGIEEARDFDNDPMGLVNFVLSAMLPPEIGVFRRSALIKAQLPFSQTMPFHVWMYNFSRLGKVRFDPLAFYREHRVMKPGLVRTSTANADWAMKYMGDEQRLGLEAMMLMALQDAGNGPITEEQRAGIHSAIDRMLHTRTSLEITRAIQRGDFILAVELRRRQALWHGPGDVGRDMEHIIVPAAKQALRAYEGYAEAPTLGELVNAYRIGARINVTV